MCLETVEGHSLRLTPDHLVQRASAVSRYQTQLEWVEAGSLRSGDRLLLSDQRSAGAWGGAYGENEGYLLGLLVGDGTLTAEKAVISVWPSSPGTEGVMQAALIAAGSLPARADFRGWQRQTMHSSRHLVLGAVRRLALSFGLSPGRKTITLGVERQSSDFYRGFLRGLFDSDGSVQGTQAKGVSVRLAQSDLPALRAVQRMLLRLGIGSTIYANRRLSGERPMPDGRGGARLYAIKAQHELVVAGENLRRFAHTVGFADSQKQNRLNASLSAYKRQLNRDRFLATVSRVEPAGEEDVFDIQVPGANAFDANGLVVHNCGEQPLLPYESCNLGSLNLARFVTAEGDKPRFDWERLARVIPDCARFLDDVIDMNRYPIEEIDSATKLTRKIGLGLMGWHDALMQLG
ncbi:MAG: LAGLIDADG family homing endonuclease, partial [Burkholderiales bacterium]